MNAHNKGRLKNASRRENARAFGPATQAVGTSGGQMTTTYTGIGIPSFRYGRTLLPNFYPATNRLNISNIPQISS